MQPEDTKQEPPTVIPEPETDAPALDQALPIPEAVPEKVTAPIGRAEITVEKWVYGGMGLARMSGGHVVMAPFLLPGETAEFSEQRRRAGMIEARVTRRLKDSAERIQPGCPYFERCGGCHYQHASYEYQLARKQDILREVFRRVGKFDAPEEIEVIAGEPWAYRNRSQFHLERGEIGYREAGSHKLCPVGHCPISSPQINEALTALRGMAKDRRWPGFVRSIELFTNEEQTLLNILETDGNRHVAKGFFNWAAGSLPGLGEGSLEYAAAGEKYRVSHSSFFQVNRFLIDRLVERALRDASGTTALDLYAGVGLFSLPLARRFTDASAVESSTSAVRDLQFNASRAELRVNVSQSTAEVYLHSLVTAPDFLIADPPRTGLGKQVTQHLARLKPARMVLVSCDPATQARDLAALRNAGYHLSQLVMVDLFPQTFHIETIAFVEA